MLVSPDNQVEEVWYEGLRYITGWTPLCSILVQHQDVEPLPEQGRYPLAPDKDVKHHLPSSASGSSNSTLFSLNNRCNRSSLTWERPYKAT